MKKTNMTPATEMIDVKVREHLLIISAGNKGIGYGGVDTSSSLDPADRDDADDLWD